MTISILYVDDDTDYHIIVSKFFKREADLSVTFCSTAHAALDLLEHELFDVIVSDYLMPVMDGISLLKEVRKRYGRLPFILFTGRGREEVVIQAINNGVDYYLQKGGDFLGQFTDLIHKIRSLYEKNAIENLARENERRFRKTLDRIHMVAFHLDENGIVQYCNDYLLSLTGWTRDEFLHKDFFEMAVPPDLREMKKRLYKEAVSKESISQHEEMKILLRSGEIRDLDIINTDMRDEKGRFLGYMCIGEDVTEKKRVRNEALSWKQRYEKLTARTGQIAYEYDIDNDILLMDESAGHVIGYAPEELRNGKELWMNIIHPDDYQNVFDTFSRAVSESEEFDISYRIKHKNGRYIWIQIQGFFDPAPDTRSKIIGIISDITREKEAEIALLKSEEKFKLYLEKAPYLVVIFDRYGRISYTNPAGEQLTGYSSAEITQMSVFDLILPEEVPETRIVFETLFERGYVHKNVTLIGKNKNIVYVEADAILLEGGEVLGFCLDITENVVNEKKISEISRKLRLLQSITRHDVMNVVTSIRGYMLLLNDFEDPAERERIFDTIIGFLKRIENLVNFSREYEQIGVHSPTWQNVAHLIEHIHTSNIPVRCAIPQDLALYADPMLDHVFANLYHNSVNHGGDVTEISCYMGIDEQGIRIIWEDNGVGIPSEEKDRIFILGYGKNSGFGLYFISEVLAMTGISITETGEYGKGARFEISVPRAMYRFESEQ
ncbi:PAS/PAC sensor hybrid histidine kinase [Methanospirillum hungatei JF-1]|uniref:histidine kinase n=1 Tax=Methanospirillum hungatei JF-1 (strain ATCC 27890 / DSM 864 / NBRC 100397 / JF-1) TaxID=323259 RepID=Q2FT10_METHJ|nr:PAS domain S-box protein [Methanospirillum hungatei]ABD42087.1 PAS/PAC sensor hybrid histidine kinase [Methanospirillum hungatei JF-1]